MVCAWRLEDDGVCFTILFLLLRVRPSLNLEPAPVILLSPSLSAEVAGAHSHAWLFIKVGTRDVKLGLYVSSASVLIH